MGVHPLWKKFQKQVSVMRQSLMKLNSVRLQAM